MVAVVDVVLSILNAPAGFDYHLKFRNLGNYKYDKKTLMMFV